MPRAKSNKNIKPKNVTAVVIAKTANNTKSRIRNKSKGNHDASSGGHKMALVHQICGITDPFCNHAKGAKYPDNSSSRTLPYPLRARGGLSTTAAGIGGFLWHPQYSFSPITYPSSYAGSVMSLNNFPIQTLVAGPSTYRIVTSGFIVRNICAPLTASGMVHIRWFANPSGAHYGSVDGLTYNCSNSIDIPLQDCKELVVITTRSPRMPQLFNEVVNDTGVVTTIIDNGFCPITVYVDGCPATTSVLDIEYLINYELTFPDSDGLSMLGTPPPPANALVTQAAAVVTSSLKTSFFKGIDRAKDYMVKAAATAIIAKIAGPKAAMQAIAVD